VSFLVGLRTYQHPCILFDGENISFHASLVKYINSTNISPIMIINKIYETQTLLSLYLVSFLVGLRTYQHPCILFDGENISFHASLVKYINSTNISPIMIINRIYETQTLLSLYLVSFLVGLRNYKHPVSVLPEGGPLRAETCSSVNEMVLTNNSALVGFLRKIVISKLHTVS